MIGDRYLGQMPRNWKHRGTKGWGHEQKKGQKHHL